MKNIIIILLVSIIVISFNIESYSQKKTIDKTPHVTKVANSKLQPFFPNLKSISAEEKVIYWNLIEESKLREWQYMDRITNPEKYKDEKSKYEKYLIDYNSLKEGLNITSLYPEYPEYIDYMNRVLDASDDFQIGNQYIINDKGPFVIGSKNNAPILILSAVVNSNIYNDLIYKNYSERAKLVINDYLLNHLSFLYKKLESTNITYLGVGVVYSHKSFAGYQSAVFEYLCMIVPVKILKKYSNGEITESVLIESAEFYLSDSNELKKVSITE